MATNNYWEICIRESFEEAKIQATEEQINEVISWVEGAHENYSLATGLDVIRSNYESESDIELKKLKKEISDNEKWVNSTKPCKRCTTTGEIIDGWGREQRCPSCEGKGRI